MDGPEEQSRAAEEVGSVAEFQDREALFEIEARLSDAQRVVERQNLRIERRSVVITSEFAR